MQETLGNIKMSINGSEPQMVLMWNVYTKQVEQRYDFVITDVKYTSLSSDGTCRTVSHGKRGHHPWEGYGYVLNLNNGTSYFRAKHTVDWIKYSELEAGIPGKPCVFPFKVNGIEFHECTSYQSPNGWPRCATKENQDLARIRRRNGRNVDRVHLSYNGSWGFCGQECPVEGTYIK